jgi:DNA-binding PadR family transcriptional regulator
MLRIVTGRMLEPSFLILAALAEEPRHGYALIQRVADLSDGRVRLRAGTLYAALDRLTGEELVAACREEVVDGRLRRYYELTELGRRALELEAQRWRSNVEVASRLLAGRPAGGLA